MNQKNQKNTGPPNMKNIPSKPLTQQKIEDPPPPQPHTFPRKSRRNKKPGTRRHKRGTSRTHNPRKTIFEPHPHFPNPKFRRGNLLKEIKPHNSFEEGGLTKYIGTWSWPTQTKKRRCTTRKHIFKLWPTSFFFGGEISPLKSCGEMATSNLLGVWVDRGWGCSPP